MFFNFCISIFDLSLINGLNNIMSKTRRELGFFKLLFFNSYYYPKTLRKNVLKTLIQHKGFISHYNLKITLKNEIIIMIYCFYVKT